jgi:uncharacterized protein (TIGR02118 family)
MVKAVVLYGPPEDADAFERYYADTHTALAQKMPGLQRFEAARGFATPDGSAVPYQRIAELTFEDMNALQAGFGSEQGQAAVNDIPSFATGGVTILLRRDRLTPSRTCLTSVRRHGLPAPRSRWRGWPQGFRPTAGA